MSPAARQRVEQTVTVIATAAMTALVQWAVYTVSLRDDVRTLKHDVARLDCRMALVAQEPVLPEGCFLAPKRGQ